MAKIYFTLYSKIITSMLPIKLKKKKILFLCVCMCMCVPPVFPEARRVIWTPWNSSYRLLWATGHGFQDLNVGPLEGQEELLTTENVPRAPQKSVLITPWGHPLEAGNIRAVSMGEFQGTQAGSGKVGRRKVWNSNPDLCPPCILNDSRLTTIMAQQRSSSASVEH